MKVCMKWIWFSIKDQDIIVEHLYWVLLWQIYNTSWFRTQEEATSHVSEEAQIIFYLPVKIPPLLRGKHNKETRDTIQFTVNVSSEEANLPNHIRTTMRIWGNRGGKYWEITSERMTWIGSGEWRSKTLQLKSFYIFTCMFYLMQ